MKTLPEMYDELVAENERMRSALKVIHTWAAFDVDRGNRPAQALDPEHTLALTRSALAGREEK